jgi:hypothetical protein
MGWEKINILEVSVCRRSIVFYKAQSPRPTQKNLNGLGKNNILEVRLFMLFFKI